MDLLQKLEKERDTLQGAVLEKSRALGDKLLLFLNTIKEDDLELLPLHVELDKPWRLDDSKSRFEVRTTIRYKNIKGETWKDGSPRDEFGCNIDLEIYEHGLKMNYGTCGTYSRNDLGQVARAKLVCKLWENEDTIVDIVKTSVDMDEYDDLLDTRSQIEQIKYDIQKEERRKQEQEVMTKLRQGVYLAKRHKGEINGHFDDNGNWTNDGLQYVYTDFETINKITDSSVLTTNEYWHDNHRRKLSEVISAIRCGTLFVLTERTLNEPITEEASVN